MSRLKMALEARNVTNQSTSEMTLYPREVESLDKEAGVQSKLYNSLLNDLILVADIFLVSLGTGASRKLLSLPLLLKAINTPDGEDQVKKRQLMELAVINGTYRAVNQRSVFSCSENSTSEDLQQHCVNEHVIVRPHPPTNKSDIVWNRE
ncbi:hypothetical protein KSF78_0003263 [Schistosoma japonicum]|nr:hypothetical protein KSF78_0003263 [Schistosoma japonicum]